MRLLSLLLLFSLSSSPLTAQSASAAAHMGSRSENERLLAIENRILTVSYPLFVAAARIIGEEERNFGFTLHDQAFYDKTNAGPYGKWVCERFNLGRGIYVRFVHPDSPAARAGLKVGDRVVSMNGNPTPSNAWKAMSELRDIGQQQQEINLAVKRGRSVRTFTIKGLEARALPVGLSGRHTLDLRIEEGQLILTQSLVDELEDDNQLALVIAHLIAKELLADKRDAMSDESGSTRAWEGEVDRLAIYITAQAGFKENTAPELWKQLAGTEKSPRFNPLSRRHPLDGYRLKQLESITKEVAEKRRKNLPVLPN